MAEVPERLIQQLSFAIRNPINVILGTLDLHQTTVTTPEQDHYLEMVHRSARQLMDASDALLDLYEINTGGLKKEPREFDVQELILEAVKFRQPAATAKNLEMEVTIDSSTISPCLADPFLLKKVLYQLLDNAVKYTDHGKISVHATRAEVPLSGQVDLPHLTVHIKDTGVGIDPGRMESLFEGPSEEVNYRSGSDGAGLGLLLARRMIELMDGSLQATSQLGEGSIFTITFPVQSIEQRTTGEMYLSGPERVSSQTEVNILCAEDDPDSRYLVEHHLRAMDYNVHMAENGKEALEACRKQRFDIILMDVQMPEMDGFEATDKIRKLPSSGSATNGRLVPIIALTAHALKQDRDTCMQAGMDDYLSKPVHREEMYSVIEYHLRAARHREDV